jgi:hypothetical protein
MQHTITRLNRVCEDLLRAFSIRDDQEEDLLRDSAGIILQSNRKSNSKPPLLPWLETLARPIHQRVETKFHLI